MGTVGDVVKDEKLIQIAVMNSYLAGARDVEEALVADAVSAFIDQLRTKYGIAVTAEQCEASVDISECDAGTQMKRVEVLVRAGNRQPDERTRRTSRRERKRAAQAV